MFENNSVSLDVILQIGTIIHHNFTKDIEEFEPIKKAFDKSSNNSDNSDFSGESWKNKYLQLLEEYNALLKEKINSSEN